MINKKSIWFLTLFSLILVLSVYYITMPSELLLTSNNNDNTDNNAPVVNQEESTLLVALRVEADEEMMKELENLRLILTNEDSTVDEKNEAFDKMKDLNIIRGEEESLEKKIKETHNLDSFVKIKNDEIQVVVKNSSHDTKLANEIMRTVQDSYESKMYISVKFVE